MAKNADHADREHIEEGDIVRTHGNPGNKNSGIFQWTDEEKRQRMIEQSKRGDKA